MYFIVAAVILLILFTSLVSFLIIIMPPKKYKYKTKNTPKIFGLSYENIVFTTKDDITLKGWFIPCQRINPKTIILLHGYPTNKSDILPVVTFLQKKYNLLAFDFRFLGESEGSYTTAGAKEKEDLLSAIRWLKTRNIHTVGVWGFSMGAAVALMGSALAPEIKAVVADSSYARLDLMARKYYPIPLLASVFGYLTVVWAKLFFNIDLKKISPLEAARSLKIPIMIIHSKHDEIISFSHAEILCQAIKNNPQSECYFDENLNHGQFDLTYQSRVDNFFQKHL